MCNTRCEEARFTNLFRDVDGEAVVGMMGALDRLENEMEGVFGREEAVALSRWNDENVDIRRNQVDLAVPVPVSNRSEDP